MRTPTPQANTSTTTSNKNTITNTPVNTPTNTAITAATTPATNANQDRQPNNKITNHNQATNYPKPTSLWQRFTKLISVSLSALLLFTTLTSVASATDTNTDETNTHTNTETTASTTENPNNTSNTGNSNSSNSSNNSDNSSNTSAQNSADSSSILPDSWIRLLSVTTGLNYIDANGITQTTTTTPTEITSTTTTWNTGWYMVVSSTTITNRITVNGNVHLILCDGATLTASNGITVSGSNSLTIYAQTTNQNTMGKLIADGTDTTNPYTTYRAGIGAGAQGQSGGTITINGGNITATGSLSAAGIGSTYNGATGGTITINGGIVNATGGRYGAAIGDAGVTNGNTTITISGGTVTANGGYDAAGIGGGNQGSGGNITITGGTITAIGGGGDSTNSGDGLGAGIGGGSYGSGGNITISGGTIKATGGVYAAGIGGGNQGSGGNITISGGTITATGGTKAAGIGGGRTGNGGTITISGGYITATGDTSAGLKGIGAGESGSTGKFTTGNNGNAIITATIGDTSAQSSWSGVINNTVYGNPTLAENYTQTGQWTIPANTSLTVPQNVTLTVNGTITRTGTPIGVLTVNGTITGSGSVTPKLTQSTAPSAPTGTQTDNTITLSVTGSSSGHGDLEYGYSTNNGTAGNWQTSNTFTNLDSGVQYTFYARYAGNNFYEPSPASSAGYSIFTDFDITTTELPTATVGQSYTASLQTNTTSNITWSIDGTLPAGLTFANGTISGTPTTATETTITVIATLQNGTSTQKASKTLALTVNAAKLATPTGLTWDSSITTKATWQTVENASSYQVQLYKDNAASGEAITTTDTSYTFDEVSEPGDYTFTVTAIGDTNYTNSDQSQHSSPQSYYLVTFDLANNANSAEESTNSNNSDTSEIASQIVVNGGKISEPAAPQKTGYTFSGWYTTQNYTAGTQWDFTNDGVTENITLYALWLSTDTSISALTVNGRNGIIDGSEITVVLPFGTSALPTDSGAIFVTTTNAGATVSTPQLVETDGSKWSFTVTAEDGEHTREYTLTVSIAADPAANNRALVDAAKSLIENQTWTVNQSEANTDTEIYNWISEKLADLNFQGVDYVLSLSEVSSASEGNADNRDGTAGAFVFTVHLSIGDDTQDIATSTYVEDTVTVDNGVITAIPYTKWTISLSTDMGGTVSGGGTFEHNSLITVIATPAEGYEFAGWMENGTLVSENANYSFAVQQDRNLTAVFTAITVPEPEVSEENTEPNNEVAQPSEEEETSDFLASTGASIGVVLLGLILLGVGSMLVTHRDRKSASLQPQHLPRK